MGTDFSIPIMRRHLTSKGPKWLWPQPVEATAIFSLPPHTCYVEPCNGKEALEQGLSRLFTKDTSSIEVLNDDGALSRLFRAVRECPQDLVTALKETDSGNSELASLCLTMRKVLAAWSASFQPDTPSSIPCTTRELYDALLAPYQRLRTVLFEALDWRTCFNRYDRPGALQLIEPSFHDVEQLEEVIHLVGRSQCSWILKIPSDMEGCFAKRGATNRVSRYEGPEGILWLISSVVK